MSVLEVWEVIYRESNEEQVKSFNWFDIDGLKDFVRKHDVVSIIFKATGLPDSQRHRVSDKEVYEERLSKEEIENVSREWIDDRRKKY